MKDELWPLLKTYFAESVIPHHRTFTLQHVQQVEQQIPATVTDVNSDQSNCHNETVSMIDLIEEIVIRAAKNPELVRINAIICMQCSPRNWRMHGIGELIHVANVLFILQFLCTSFRARSFLIQNISCGTVTAEKYLASMYKVRCSLYKRKHWQRR